MPKAMKAPKASICSSVRCTKTQAIDGPLYELIDLKEPQLKELLSCFDDVETRTYPAQSIVFMPEDPLCERLYIVRQGKVELYRLTSNGKRLVTRRLLPGSIFGIRGLFCRKMQKNIAETVEDSVLGIINRDQVLTLLQHRPELMQLIFETVCNRLIFLEDLLVDMMYNPVDVKLAHFLLANIDASGTLVNTTHEEIADTIGVVRQTITEKLSLMQKRGILITERKRIRVIDRCKLVELVEK